MTPEEQDKCLVWLNDVLNAVKRGTIVITKMKSNTDVADEKDEDGNDIFTKYYFSLEADIPNG